MGNHTIFLDVRKSWEGQTSKKFYNKCSENSRFQIVFRTDIFRKLTLGAPKRLACSMKASMSGLLMSHREKISSMWHFQTVVLKTVLLRVVVSIYVMKILAKE